MQKIDYKKELKHLYNPAHKEVQIVDIPVMNYLMADGHGNPNTAPIYQEVVEALFALAYAIKFKVKKGSLGIDYGVLPLEGLWWVADMREFSVEKKDAWDWTMMIMQPAFITAEMVADTLAEVKQQKGLPALDQIRFESYEEGLSVQVMHLGPYADEAPTVARLHAHAAELGYRLEGKHHEIYLSDPRRSSPAKMKTVLRQPVRL